MDAASGVCRVLPAVAGTADQGNQDQPLKLSAASTQPLNLFIEFQLVREQKHEHINFLAEEFTQADESPVSL